MLDPHVSSRSIGPSSVNLPCPEFACPCLWCACLPLGDRCLRLLRGAHWTGHVRTSRVWSLAILRDLWSPLGLAWRPSSRTSSGVYNSYTSRSAHLPCPEFAPTIPPIPKLPLTRSASYRLASEDPAVLFGPLNIASRYMDRRCLVSPIREEEEE